jgi:hypothetical protein
LPRIGYRLWHSGANRLFREWNLTADNHALNQGRSNSLDALGVKFVGSSSSPVAV